MGLNKLSNSVKLETTGMLLVFILKSNKEVKYYNKLLEGTCRSLQKAGGIPLNKRKECDCEWVVHSSKNECIQQYPTVFIQFSLKPALQSISTDSPAKLGGCRLTDFSKFMWKSKKRINSNLVEVEEVKGLQATVPQKNLQSIFK